MSVSKKMGTRLLTKKEYEEDLFADREKAKWAFEKAWETRNFEIEMYWKRATYFWAFIASTFVGYFAAITSKAPNPGLVFMLVCIGFILSCAWYFTNKGSKTWQRHWETHVDLLEDEFTGPLYKTVNETKTYSVSKINEIISLSFSAIWFMLGIKVFLDHTLNNTNWYIITVGFIIVCIAIYEMKYGHGRGRFSERVVKMHRRKVRYASDAEIEDSIEKLKETPRDNKLLNWLYAHKMIVGMFAVIISVITGILEFMGHVDVCPFGGTQHIVIGLLGILIVLPTMTSGISRVFAILIAALGFMGGTEHFPDWVRLMNREFEWGNVISWIPSGFALLIITGLLMYIWTHRAVEVEAEAEEHAEG